MSLQGNNLTKSEKLLWCLINVLQKRYHTRKLTLDSDEEEWDFMREKYGEGLVLFHYHTTKLFINTLNYYNLTTHNLLNRTVNILFTFNGITFMFNIMIAEGVHGLDVAHAYHLQRVNFYYE